MSMLRNTEAHVPLAQGRIGLPPVSFPNGLCNDALPLCRPYRRADGDRGGLQQRVYPVPVVVFVIR